MKILLAIAFIQSLNLAAFAYFNRVACVRIFALRQQLNVYKQMSKKPQLRNRDRLFCTRMDQPKEPRRLKLK